MVANKKSNLDAKLTLLTINSERLLYEAGARRVYRFSSRAGARALTLPIAGRHTDC